MESAVISEKPLRRYFVLVQNIHQRNSILAQRRGENDNFKVFTNFIKEFAAVRPHFYENIASAPFNVNRKFNVSLTGLEWTMDEGFVDVENQSFAPFEGFCLRTQKIVRWCVLQLGFILLGWSSSWLHCAWFTPHIISLFDLSQDA